MTLKLRRIRSARKELDTICFIDTWNGGSVPERSGLHLGGFSGAGKNRAWDRLAGSIDGNLPAEGAPELD